MGNTPDNPNEPGLSYDPETIAGIMKQISGIIDYHQPRFARQVTQGPLSLAQMAGVLSLLDPRLRDFPSQVTQWQKGLDQHMTALSSLCQTFQRGVQGVQQIDTGYGHQLSNTDPK